MGNKFSIYVLLLGMALYSGVATAAEEPERSISLVDNVKSGLAFEAALGILSYWGAQSPRSLGVVVALTSPLGIGGESGGMSKVASWVMVGGFEAMAIYNLRVDEKKTTNRERFRANEIGWHAAIGVSALVAYLTRDEQKKDKKMSFSYLPEPQGGKLMLSYRF
jgi:hypothetical protein